MSELLADGSGRVRVGYNLPSCAGVLCAPHLARTDVILRLASGANDLGFNSVWVNDHMVTPDEMRTLESPDFFESLTTSAIVGASVPDITVGVASIILPFRDPVVLAKQLTTIDAFLPGRFLAAIVIGRYESEYVAYGSELYRRRGRVANEYLEIMEKLSLQDGDVSFDGEFRSLSRAGFYPKLTGASRLPVWVGGNSKAAMLRAHRFGRAWLITQELDADRIAGMFDAGGLASAPPAIPLVLSVTIMGQGSEELSSDIHRHARAMSGSASEVAGQLNEYVRAGVDHLILDFPRDEEESIVRDMAWFAEEVRPLLANVGQSV